MLAYSSMSQLGYIVTAIALTSHLGWVTAFYLTANHMMVKGILFLAATALILRTGTRSIANLGGLARSMPLTFGLSAFAIVAMSGLPPLAGFGGKWLLLSAMMDKEWYGLVVIGVLATFAGFLYMWHFLQAVFLSAPAATRERIAEAPSVLLIPQFLLAAGIIVMSFYPKLLIEPLSRAIDPYFASTLIWNGMSLELIYAYWNPIPVMAVAVAASALLFGVFWLLRNIRWRSTSNGRAKAGSAPANDSVYDYCQSVCTALTPPCAYAFWDSVASALLFIGGRLRLLYTGDGQTYNLYILYYFIVLYIACGGASHIWMGS
jgi:NADH:ubiquinone oxidoreductase subunit 5 (subunit L)/multisubunit Na+/H+ antiporter MnhA subunit